MSSVTFSDIANKVFNKLLTIYRHFAISLLCTMIMTILGRSVQSHQRFLIIKLAYAKIMIIASVCTKYCILAALLLTFLPGDLTYVIVAGLFLVMKVAF